MPKSNAQRTEYTTGRLDMNRYLIKNPLATFYVKVERNQPAANLMAGDLLVVDRSLIPEAGDVVIVEENGELAVRRWSGQQEVWGVATHVIHELSTEEEWPDVIEEGGAR